MSELVARTGRHQQLYKDGYRLIAGCIPFRCRHFEEDGGDKSEKIVEVLMISSTSGGPGLLFPKKIRFHQEVAASRPTPATLCWVTRHQAVLDTLRWCGVGCVEAVRNRLTANIGAGVAWHLLHSGGCVESVLRQWYRADARGPTPAALRQGGWENDETVEEAAVREAIEEAGVRGELMHFLGNYHFKSKTLQDEFSPEGLCKAAMYALLVKEELQCWPEQNLRERRWLTIPEAIKCCRHAWMREALENGFSKWYADGMISSTINKEKDNHENCSVSSSPDQQ